MKVNKVCENLIFRMKIIFSSPFANQFRSISHSKMSSEENMDTSNAENIAEVVAGPEAPSEVSLASAPNGCCFSIDLN